MADTTQIWTELSDEIDDLRGRLRLGAGPMPADFFHTLLMTGQVRAREAMAHLDGDAYRTANVKIAATALLAVEHHDQLHDGDDPFRPLIGQAGAA